MNRYIVVGVLVAGAFGCILAGGGHKENAVCWVGGGLFIVAMVEAVTGLITSKL